MLVLIMSAFAISTRIDAVSAAAAIAMTLSRLMTMSATVTSQTARQSVSPDLTVTTVRAVVACSLAALVVAVTDEVTEMVTGATTTDCVGVCEVVEAWATSGSQAYVDYKKDWAVLRKIDEATGVKYTCK